MRGENIFKEVLLLRMMSYRGVFLLCLIVLSVSIVSAANASETDMWQKASTCLTEQVAGKPSISFQEAVATILALGANTKALSVIDSEEKKEGNGSCWPKAGCTIKDTAQALLALRQAGRSTTNAEQWLLSKNGTATDLAWFLEIDSDGQRASTCTIKYGSSTNTVRIGNDMRLSGNAGSCLTFSPSEYLLRVKESCLDTTFQVSCNESFTTAFIYQKDKGTSSDCLQQNNETCFVADSSQSAASLGTNEIHVVASCFKQSGKCDYEGSLWATFAFSRVNRQIDSFLPYLVALGEGYERFFSSSFLYGLTGNTDYFSNVVQLQKLQGYWELSGSPYSRFYDSAIGLLGIGGQPEADATKQYLASVQTKEGCWNNNRIVDTGFLLYAGSGRAGSSGTGGSGSSAFCEEAGFFCGRQDACASAGGVLQGAFECTGFGICCSKQMAGQSCSSLSGTVCRTNQVCSGKNLASSDANCCLGTCDTAVTTTDNECEAVAGGSCRSSCDSGEEVSTDACTNTQDVCCVSSRVSTGSSNWPWILVIGILILLIILAIIYKDSIRIWYYTRKAKPVVARTLPPRPVQRPVSTGRAPMRATGSKSNEFEDTLRKLRDMSK